MKKWIKILNADWNTTSYFVGVFIIMVLCCAIFSNFKLTVHAQNIDPKDLQIRALQQENYELRTKISQLQYELNESDDNVEPIISYGTPSCPNSNYEIKYIVTKKQVCDGVKKVNDDSCISEEVPTDCEDRKVFKPVCAKKSLSNTK